MPRLSPFTEHHPGAVQSLVHLPEYSGVNSRTCNTGKPKACCWKGFVMIAPYQRWLVKRMAFAHEISHRVIAGGQEMCCHLAQLPIESTLDDIC